MKEKSCYFCRYHHVYWRDTQFDGCECKAWQSAEDLHRHHACGGHLDYSVSRQSGHNCPRFVYFPPEEMEP